MIQVLYGTIEPCSCSVEPFCVSFWLDSYCIVLSTFQVLWLSGRVPATCFMDWDGLSPRFLLPNFRCDLWTH